MVSPVNTADINMKQVFFILFLINFSGFLLSAEIDQVDDSDLIHLLTGDQNVVAVFTKSNCKECDELEAVVENIQGELKETLGAVVVKAHNTQLISIYNPQKEPSLIFFRKGIPLIYNGELNEHEILQMFSENRDPIVKELSDENFEHLTQASTGSTTGDWFVFFYSADCVICQRLYAVWETVGAKVRQHTNVARVNRLGPGVLTAKRFGITTSPEFLFIRQGKVYRYKGKEYTPERLIEFAEKGYRKQTHPEDVPIVRSIFDELVEEYSMFFFANKSCAIFGGIAAILFIFACCLKCYSRTKPEKIVKKKAK